MQRFYSKIKRRHTGVSPETFQLMLKLLAVTAFLFIKRFSIMLTEKVNSASTVAEVPTLHGIQKQEEKVNYYKELFLQNLASKEIESYRKVWVKARAELSRMQVAYHFAGKGVCHV